MNKSNINPCCKEILSIIKSKKWFNNVNNNLVYWGKKISPMYLTPNGEQILINRNCASSIYSRYDLQKWERLDKYFIEIFEHILKKYNIKEIGFVGDCVDNSIDANDKTFYRGGEDDKWYNSWECEMGLNIEQTLINKMSKDINDEILKNKLL